MRIATLTLMLSCSLAIAPRATAEETRVDVIFTGVVPPACVVEAPANNTSANHDRQEYTFQTDGSAQVVCNDEAHVNSEEFTSTAQLDANLESTSSQADAREFLTITAP